MDFRSVSALVLLLAPASSPALDFLRSNDTLLASGPIQKGDAARFAARLSGVKRLRIHSEGGSAGEAMAIGDLIARHRISVLVDGLCGSACAQMIVPAAPSKRVLKGGVLVWHGEGQAALSVWLEEAGKLRALGEPYSHLYAIVQDRVDRLVQIREQLEAYNARYGISQAGVSNLDRLTFGSGEDYALELEDAVDGLGLRRLRPMRCLYWLPDRVALAQIGVHMDAYPQPDIKKWAHRMRVPESAIYTGSVFDAMRMRAQCGVEVGMGTGTGSRTASF